MGRFKMEFKVGGSRLKVSEDTPEETMDAMLEIIKEVTSRWKELDSVLAAGTEVLIDEAKRDFFELIMADIEKKVSEVSYRNISKVPVNDFISLWEDQLDEKEIEDPCGGGCVIEGMDSHLLEEMLHKIYQSWILKEMVDTQ